MSADDLRAIAVAEMAALVLQLEGGVADVKGDAGGLTSTGGQTRAWLEDLYGRPVSDDEIRNLTPAQAEQNIEAWINTKTNMDALLLPDGVDACAAHIIDFAYQSGEGTALPMLQRILGLTSTAPIVGPQTAAAFTGRDRQELAWRMLAARLRFEGRIFERDYRASADIVISTLTTHGIDPDVISVVKAKLAARQEKFAAGWLNRIAAVAERFA